MLKLFLSMLFGADMRNSLLTYLAVTALFYFAGWQMPHGWWAFSGIAVVGFFGHLPDYDLVPYKLLLKRKETHLFVLGVAAAAAMTFVTSWVHDVTFMTLGFMVLCAFLLGIAEGRKVRERASHWPIWHYPVLVIPASALFTYVFASDYAPAYVEYFLNLALTPLVLHFAHDCLQEQGFPLVSLGQRFDAHWRLRRWFIFPRFERVPSKVVKAHYKRQYDELHNQTSMEDLQRRADRITGASIVAFIVLLGASCALAWYLR